MYINSLKRDITIGTKTRKIAREVNEELMRWVTVSWQDMNNIQFPAINADKAEELLVRLMCNISQWEMDSLTEDEYIEIKTEISKKK